MEGGLTVNQHYVAPDPDAPRKVTRVVEIETETIRDLQIVYVPLQWQFVRNDDQIKARIEQETVEMWARGGVAYQVDGASRPIPRHLGLLRDFDTVLVRKAEDLDGVQVEHPDCQECVDSLEQLRTSLRLMPPNATPIVAVVQFTFDQIVDAKTEQFDVPA